MSCVSRGLDIAGGWGPIFTIGLSRFERDNESTINLGIFASDEDIMNISSEILKMFKFDHPNVMKLIGVCVEPTDHGDSGLGPCIVMPFMAKGSLLDFLRKEKNLIVQEEANILVTFCNLHAQCKFFYFYFFFWFCLLGN